MAEDWLAFMGWLAYRGPLQGRGAVFVGVHHLANEIGVKVMPPGAVGFIVKSCQFHVTISVGAS